MRLWHWLKMLFSAVPTTPTQVSLPPDEIRRAEMLDLAVATLMDLGTERGAALAAEIERGRRRDQEPPEVWGELEGTTKDP